MHVSVYFKKLIILITMYLPSFNVGPDFTDTVLSETVFNTWL